LSASSVLETRGLHALPREEAVDCLAVHAKDATDADGVEPSVVDQPPDRLGVDTELRRHLTDADEAIGFRVHRRHNSNLSQVRAHGLRQLTDGERTFELRLDAAVRVDEKRPGF
jgi:hypothetical protein